MTAVYTSRVWLCWDATFDALAAVTWPVHPSTNVAPVVQFAGSRDVAQEMVTVPGIKPPEGPGSSYATLGVVGRDEHFTLIIEIWSQVPGFVNSAVGQDPSRAVRDRLRDLTALVESTFRDATTGRPKGVNILNVWKYEITATLPYIEALPTGGYGGTVIIELTFTARI